MGFREMMNVRDRYYLYFISAIGLPLFVHVSAGFFSIDSNFIIVLNVFIFVIFMSMLHALRCKHCGEKVNAKIFIDRICRRCGNTF